MNNAIYQKYFFWNWEKKAKRVFASIFFHTKTTKRKNAVEWIQSHARYHNLLAWCYTWNAFVCISFSPFILFSHFLPYSRLMKYNSFFVLLFSFVRAFWRTIFTFLRLNLSKWFAIIQTKCACKTIRYHHAQTNLWKENENKPNSIQRQSFQLNNLIQSNQHNARIFSHK